MATPSVITELRPVPKPDPTAALRARRARQKQKAAAEKKPSDIKASVTVASRPALPWSVWPLATTTVGLMAVSLTHLSDGVIELTSIPTWQGWAMAGGIDCLLISVALAQLTAMPDVKHDIRHVARAMEAGTLIMSAGLNALAFTGGAFDASHWAQIAFGCFVPAAISGATYILARLTKR
jgi:hypothetical protein